MESNRERSANLDVIEPYVPLISPEDLARRNAEAIRILDLWETEGDEADQRATMAVIREALGPGRVMSNRNQFP
jgi:hypothetical protein